MDKDKLGRSLTELAKDGIAGRRSTLYALIESGELEAIKVGRRTIILEESLRAYLKRQPRWKPTPIAPNKARAKARAAAAPQRRAA